MRVVELNFRAVLCAVFAWALMPVAALAEGGSLFPGEPPVIARLLDDGIAAEAVGFAAGAEARYCWAARLGSVEGQYRLGKFYQTHPRPGLGPTVATTLLSFAAQRGHLEAQKRLGGRAPGRIDTPACFEQALDIAVIKTLGRVISRQEVGRYIAELPASRRPHAQMVQRLAPRYGVDPRFALAIVRNESGFDPKALSPKNAMGLMQLIPETAARFKVTDAFDPEQNVRGGLAYLRWLLDRFDGDIALTAAAYNAGEGAVQRHEGVPPYAETREYVARVLGFYRASQHVRPALGAG